MSSKKRGSGADSYYHQHLFGNFKTNPVNNRVAVLERMYWRVLTELAVNRFKWTGFPSSIDVRFLELTLFRQALSVFYFDDKFDKFFALRGGSNNYINMVDNPTSFLVVGNNFVSKTVSAKIAVPIWANYLRVPDVDIVSIYAAKLADFDRTIEVNGKSARRTKVIAVNENQKLSATNINRQIDEGQPVVTVAGPLQDMAFVQALDLGVEPKTIQELHVVRTRLWNECMGLLGIENANQDKTERLVSGEVEANEDQTSMMRYVNLNARREAAEAINKRYKLDVQVEYRTDSDRNAALEIGDSDYDSEEL